MTVRCADAALAANEPLGGTGMVGTRFVCVESRTAWDRDAVASGFPPEVATWLGDLDATVLAIRRPGRRGPLTVYVADVAEIDSTLRRFEVSRVEEIVELDLEYGGDHVGEPLFLVCTHGRRDACCSRLGIPVYSALNTAVRDADRVWQCSHTGGHRFAANVVVLPHGATLGRVDPSDAGDLVEFAAQGRVPLGSYRGRSIYPPHVQAAEVAVRAAHGLDGVDQVRLVSIDADIGEARAAKGEVVFETVPDGVVRAVSVSRVPGPVLAKSCGAEIEQLEVFVVDLDGETEAVGA